MKMPKPLEDAFNAQVTMELGASISYLQMSAFFAAANLSGMSTWMRAQSAEEISHAHRFLDFVLDRGNPVVIGEVTPPVTAFNSPSDVFAASLEQERQVTLAIHNLYHLASEHGDLGSLPFLQEFISEQNEEEATVETILERMRMAGTDSGAILLLDSELGGRTRGPGLDG